MDLISKPRSKSIVWLYFGLKADEKGQPLNSGEAVCRLCRKIVLAKGGNTTNLRSHLRRRHRADFFETTSSTTSGALFEAQGDLPPNSALSLQQFGNLKCASNLSHIAFAAFATTACMLPPSTDKMQLQWGTIKLHCSGEQSKVKK